MDDGWKVVIKHDPGLSMHWEAQLVNSRLGGYVKSEYYFTSWGARLAGKRWLRKARRGGFTSKKSQVIK